jgi:hypothetical protein
MDSEKYCTSLSRSEELREAYIEEMKKYAAEDLVFLDEAIFNEKTGWRYREYGPQGERIQYTANRFGPATCILCLISLPLLCDIQLTGCTRVRRRGRCILPLFRSRFWGGACFPVTLEAARDAALRFFGGIVEDCLRARKSSPF